MIGIIIGGLAVGFGVIMIALLRMAKQTDIDSGIEPSLGQEDRFVFLKDADEIDDILDMDEF